MGRDETFSFFFSPPTTRPPRPAASLEGPKKTFDEPLVTREADRTKQVTGVARTALGAVVPLTPGRDGDLHASGGRGGAGSYGRRASV